MTWGADDYPGSAAPESYGNDRWDYAWANCTSFAMHRVVDDIHQGPYYWGSGKDFASRAAAQGKSVDGSPRQYDIFSLPAYAQGCGQYGHCGVVLEVDAANGRFLAEDYNWVARLAYGKHWLKIAGVSFIHLEPNPAPPPPGPHDYVVQSGDTYSGIAQKFGVSLPQLEQANPQGGHPPGNYNVIYPGDVVHIPGAAPTPPTPPPAPHDTLSEGQWLMPGSSLFSAGGRFELAMQRDGNLVIYDHSPFHAIWSINLGGGHWTPKGLIMQTDGNAVVYYFNRGPWATGSNGPYRRLVMQDDGNLVVYSGAGNPVWASNTGGR